MESLKELLKSMGLPEQEIGKLIEIGKYKKIERLSYFIREGQVPDKLAFVKNGLFRYVYIDKEGNEYTKNFITENNFITSYSAMIHRTPSYFYIETLEDSEILEIDYLKWIELKETNACWNSFLVKILERAFSIKEKREREFLLLDAESRYQIFLDEYPGLDKRVRQQDIASYIGVKPESLSRIRKTRLLT